MNSRSPQPPFTVDPAHDTPNPEAATRPEHRARRRPDELAYFEAVLGAMATEGNQITHLKNGDEIFPAMLAAIRQAQHTIEFVTFVYWQGEIAHTFAEALAAKAQAGVDVKVVLDGIGAHPIKDKLVEKMKDSGVQVVWFRPPKTWRLWRLAHRTHRKLLICDGDVGFTGGVGIAEEWTGDAEGPGSWRDDHYRVEGPAVSALRAGFVTNWAEITRDLPFEPDDTSNPGHQQAPGDAWVHVIRATASFGQNDIATIIQAAIRSARRRLRIATAYLVPDGPHVKMLADAAARGVQVELMAPGQHSDSTLSQLAGQRWYAALLEAGVKLWSYEKTMLHRKAILIDDTLSIIGSPNLNHRSLSKDDELCMLVHDRDLNATLSADYDEDIEGCEPIDPQRWARRGWLQRVKERLASWFFKGQV